MIAVDINILVYAHRRDSKFHERALQAVRQLAESSSAWAIPWPCIHEFFSVTTNPRAFQPVSTPLEARQQIASFLASPSLVLLAETERHWSVLEELLDSALVRGMLIHDAKIAAICIQHGVRKLWSSDRDFSRFPELKTVNPLLG